MAKRGRPKGSKNKKQELPKKIKFEEVPSSDPLTSEFISNQESEIPTEPQKEDTTEESKLFLKGIFEVPAGLLNDRRIALFDDQVQALSPSFKMVYDLHIKPALGEKAYLYIFAIGFVSVLGEKIPYIVEDVQKLKKVSNARPQAHAHNDHGYPSPEGDGKVDIVKAFNKTENENHHL